jgi:hypothetical protein
MFAARVSRRSLACSDPGHEMTVLLARTKGPTPKEKEKPDKP